MDDGDHAWVMALQLLTIGWVPKQLLQKAVFDTFIFEGGVGVQKSLTRTDPQLPLRRIDRKVSIHTGHFKEADGVSGWGKYEQSLFDGWGDESLGLDG